MTPRELGLELRRRIDEVWSGQPQDLPAAGGKLLDLVGTIDIDNALQGIVTEDIGKQKDNDNSLPLPKGAFTLYADDAIEINIFVWMLPHMVPHDHDFFGFWLPLEGTFFECRYDFELEHDLGCGFMSGELRLYATRVVRPGDYGAVVPGETCLHQVWHLDRPSISIFVNTPSAQVGLTYEGSLAAPYPVTGTVTEQLSKRLHALEILGRTGSPAYDPSAASLFSTLDALQAFHAVNRLRMLGLPLQPALAALPDPLGQALGNFAGSRERWERVRWEGGTTEQNLALALLFSCTDREQLLAQTRGLVDVDVDAAAWLAAQISGASRDARLASLPDGSEQLLAGVLSGSPVPGHPFVEQLRGWLLLQPFVNPAVDAA